MRVRLEHDQLQKLTAALVRAGTREIGGQLYGEQLAPSDFRIIELTVQSRPGTFVRFMVDLFQTACDATRFFDRTGHRYTRFNYLGEWHSHPSFEVQPSTIDIETMRQLVCDPLFRGNFALLMIVRLNNGSLTKGAWVFDPQGTKQVITLEIIQNE